MDLYYKMEKEMDQCFEKMKQIFDSMDKNQRKLFLKSLAEETEENKIMLGKSYEKQIETIIRKFFLATIVMMVAGAILNAAAFTGGNIIAKSISGSSESEVLAETKRKDDALIKYQEDLKKIKKKKMNLMRGFIKERKKRIRQKLNLKILIRH